ncbi:MAG: T9SS type A sorting domain-containing protein, partial [Paludibacter sp.]
LSSRAKSDLDGNGLVEPWEFTNETKIVSDNLTTDFDAMIFSSVTNSKVDGVTFHGINIAAGSSIELIKIDAAGCEFDNSTVESCNVNALPAWAGPCAIVALLNGKVQNCLMQDNVLTTSAGGTTPRGGGLAIRAALGNSPQAIGCVIRGNQAIANYAADGMGGGVYITAYSTNAYITDANTNPALINCVVYNNHSSGQGGGIYQNGGEIINCTVAENNAGFQGGGIFTLFGGQLYNSIAWNNLCYAIWPNDAFLQTNTTDILESDYMAIGEIEFAGTPPTITNQLNLTRGYAQGPAPSNTVNDDVNVTLAPHFVNPTTFDSIPVGADQILAMHKANFQLATGSPCLDYASTDLLTALNITTDLMGGDRFVNSIADLGAYEGAVATGLKEVKFGYGIYGVNQHIVLSGLPLDQMLTVYNFAGQLVKSMKIYNSSMSIGISKGIYLVRVGNQATKVLVP